MSGTVSTALLSADQFVAGLRSLRLAHGRLGKLYHVADGTYRIFRETRRDRASGEPVVLVIGFRLKLIRSSAPLHWLFQRICILTTPFWSGLPGFHTKLWMVDPVTKNYLGIYDWRGRTEAQRYINFLLPILRFFSVGGSVWAEQHHDTELNAYLLSSRRAGRGC